MSTFANCTIRSLAALIREASYELRETLSKHPARGTFAALVQGSNKARSPGWSALKNQAWTATRALQKDEEVDARIAFALLLERLDEADKMPYCGRGCSADLIILEEANFAPEEKKTTGVDEMD